MKVGAQIVLEILNNYIIFLQTILCIFIKSRVFSVIFFKNLLLLFCFVTIYVYSLRYLIILSDSSRAYIVFSFLSLSFVSEISCSNCFCLTSASILLTTLFQFDNKFFHSCGWKRFQRWSLSKMNYILLRFYLRYFRWHFAPFDIRI